MELSVIIALVGTVAALGGSMAAILLKRDTSSQQLAGAQAYETLTKALTNLTEQNEGLRHLLNEKESYIVYLVNGIRERCSWKPLDFLKWQTENSLVDGQSPLVEALLDAFDLASFDQMLRIHVGRQREEITTAGNLRQIVFEVVESAERENWLSQLKRGALAANPTNQQLQNL